MSKNKIIPQMFDIRPVKKTGDLDWDKINGINNNYVRLDDKQADEKEIKQKQEDEARKKELDERMKKSEMEILEKRRMQEEEERLEKEKQARELREKILKRNQEQKERELKIELSKEKIPLTVFKKIRFSFGLAAALIALGIGGISYVYKGLGIQGKVLGTGQEGYENLVSAVGDISREDLDSSAQKFALAHKYFSEASLEMDKMGTIVNKGTRFIPYVSKISSGKNMIEAAKYFSLAGEAMNESIKEFINLKNSVTSGGSISLLGLFENTKVNVEISEKNLKLVQEHISKVKVDDLPEEMKEKFIQLKKSMPEVIGVLEAFSENSHIFTDILGGNGPRKYLFLFQNNNEMRATGGFIGTYGLLDISNGHVRDFFIDGIFNPDGQLQDKVVPPAPIQKISAAWSLHDSNWFPDFPVSAKEAIVFYERTGGPTVDGVITITPVVLQKLLEITGPIEMTDYEVILDSENFIEKTQNKVEKDYDKKENKPKKILSDLAPMILDRIVKTRDIETVSKVAQVFLESLNEKHILIFSENRDLQEIISKRGWSGEILDTEKDYLSVINTNINGYKTDGVIEEKIEHKAEIQNDGSIIDTVAITRKHNGGNTDYEWWNKVNANYMRVYVPRGSQLLEVEGQTREINEPALDYDKLKFERDELVEKEENSMIVDEKTGTRIYEDAGKTVFANWTYVSPQETMTIKYKYLLPFRLFQSVFKEKNYVDSYSLIAQKQSGSVGSFFDSQLQYPEPYEIQWKSLEYENLPERVIHLETDLKSDKFGGVVFEKQMPE
ncbi:MAG: hypothetical protein ACD_11C00021G0009 [uncultured bacterium]|nr:MAG: hypothetical protein ACD_11C00021G0009 [uncultured bacterium]